MAGPRSGVAEATDEALVEQARGGDPAAREELFRRGRDVAFRVAYRLLGDADDAMDAVQDGFIKAFRNLDSFDGRAAFRTWLLRIVSNAARDLGRRRGRRPALRLTDLEGQGDGNPSAAAEPSVEVDPARKLDLDELRRALDEALGKLTPTLRDTIVLQFEGGLSYQEIADAQEVPIGTVMSRIHAAKRKLREHPALRSYLEAIGDEP